jgi:hypothetical protein
MRSLTVDDILGGVALGDVQSAGAMQVVPLLGDDLPVDLAPPRLCVSTQSYGTVKLRNDSDRPTLVPTSAGWVVKQAAQDHAIASAAFIGAGETRSIDTAMCIQQTQAGLIRSAEHEMLILPAPLRGPALAGRNTVSFNKLWGDIDAFNERSGVGSGGGHLVRFLAHYARELDEFVAEFERVPGQVGAAVLVGGELAGVERTPSASYFAAVFEPLIRVCYGALAVNRNEPPRTRAPLELVELTLAGLAGALGVAERREREAVLAVIDAHRGDDLECAEIDERYGELELRTISSPAFAGQVVTGDRQIAYASVCAVALEPIAASRGEALARYA